VALLYHLVVGLAADDFVVRFRRPFLDEPRQFRIRLANFGQCFLQPLDARSIGRARGRLSPQKFFNRPAVVTTDKRATRLIRYRSRVFLWRYWQTPASVRPVLLRRSCQGARAGRLIRKFRQALRRDDARVQRVDDKSKSNTREQNAHAEDFADELARAYGAA
jgi:hypothetical protein